ncbi:DUF4259 domain-containing protein [Paenibacillus sp. PR3]|uniref:DUF4259 domain-containing protein n=1 Tax=Paenibacillus terricola TaxID=2763503 RepID=A0ABR8MU52_9BACL|nr:DUF4259 domain-containing protein [Paenibacillus terricola]MBD3918606.1 DUF4259 domain-containing protein [Paenibacillus terricola]
MGAWGYGNLENDTVLDWIAELIETDDMSLISESIEFVVEDDDIDADVASIAIGAIEVLAALQDRRGNEEYDEELNDWINEHKGKGKNLLPRAQKALQKIVLDSELKDLWEESESFEEWLKTIKELESRLN